MSHRKITAIALLVTSLSAALILFLDRIIPLGLPEWLYIVLALLAVVGVVFTFFALAIGVAIISNGMLAALTHRVVIRYGIRTTCTIVHSSPCQDSEDACWCGRYRFADEMGQEHEFKFKICLHWPSDEQWKLVEQGYSKGAQNPVCYLRRLPCIHDVQFPI